MNTPKDLILELINCSITSFFRSKKPKSTFWFDGLGNLEWYNIVFLLDNGKKYNLEENQISLWTENETLVNLKTDQISDYRNQPIVKIIEDENQSMIFILLNNQMVIRHNTFFGSELSIEPYKEVFDDKGNLI